MRGLTAFSTTQKQLSQPFTKDQHTRLPDYTTTPLPRYNSRQNSIERRESGRCFLQFSLTWYSGSFASWAHCWPHPWQTTLVYVVEPSPSLPLCGYENYTSCEVMGEVFLQGTGNPCSMMGRGRLSAEL